jgi:chromosome segregation ATPase
MVRARETHDSVINNVKQKHENEAVLLKGEIEGLKYELNSKNNEINSLNKQIDKLKSENHENSYTERLKEMVQITKDLWEKEMKDKVQNDIKTIVESAEKTWSKNSELELINAKRNWETELQTEIVQIIALLKSKAKISTESLPSNVSLRFVPLLNLWHALENACDSKEQALITQSNKLKEAQKQLEEALAESRLNFSVNPPISASNDALMSELKVELQNVKEEAIQMKHKLNKYKQHYHQLVKKHKNEIERIKSEFASILEAFKQNLK